MRCRTSLTPPYRLSIAGEEFRSKGLCIPTNAFKIPLESVQDFRLKAIRFLHTFCVSKCRWWHSTLGRHFLDSSCLSLGFSGEVEGIGVVDKSV